MKNEITLTLRAFPVLAHDHRTGKEADIKVVLTKEQLRAARRWLRDASRSATGRTGKAASGEAPRLSLTEFILATPSGTAAAIWAAPPEKRLPSTDRLPPLLDGLIFQRLARTTANFRSDRRHRCQRVT
jgi:hypothetical protein